LKAEDELLIHAVCYTPAASSLRYHVFVVVGRGEALKFFPVDQHTPADLLELQPFVCD
jgi:hypothetical protein